MPSTLVLLVAVVVTIPLNAKLNQWRGQPEERPGLLFNKTVVILVQGVVLGVPVVLAALMRWDADSMTIVAAGLGGTVVGVLVLLIPSWGELFPHGRNTAAKDFAPGVKRLGNYLAGFDYTVDTPDGQDVRWWQTVGMGVRWALYGIPLALVVSLATQSAGGLALVPGLMVVGLLYNRSNYLVGEPDFVAHAEQRVGGYLAALVGLCLL